MLRRLTSTSASWAPFPLRLALGVAFIGHGAQKVFGSFGGPGFAKFTSFPAPFSFMRPSAAWMGVAAFAELIGGALVLLGLFTRVGAFLITCVMLTAIFGVLTLSLMANQVATGLALSLFGVGSLAGALFMAGRSSKANVRDRQGSIRPCTTS